MHSETRSKKSLISSSVQGSLILKKSWSQIPYLRSWISNLKSQITALSFQIPEHWSQITDLRSQISDLTSQISDLTSQISDLRSQITDRKSLRPFSSSSSSYIGQSAFSELVLRTKLKIARRYLVALFEFCCLVNLQQSFIIVTCQYVDWLF